MGGSRRGIDLLRALVDRASVFDIPDEVLFCTDLSRERKIDILLRWEYEAREGAGRGAQDSVSPDPASELGQVLTALKELGLPHRHVPGPPAGRGGA